MLVKTLRDNLANSSRNRFDAIIAGARSNKRNTLRFTLGNISIGRVNAAIERFALGLKAVFVCASLLNVPLIATASALQCLLNIRQ